MSAEESLNTAVQNNNPEASESDSSAGEAIPAEQEHPEPLQDDNTHIEHTTVETPAPSIEYSEDMERSFDHGSAYEEAYEKLYTEILEHFRTFSPSDQIAGKLTEEHITNYLESSREERLQQYKERREHRLFTALELIAILASIVLVVWFLKDNPAILVNILYIIGGLGALFIWKYPHEKKDRKD